MTERFRTNWRVQGPLLGFLVVTLVLAFVVFRYFLLTFTVAASVALMLSSVQGALSRRLGNRDGLAAALLVLAATFVILIPVILYGTLIFQQAVAFLDWLQPHLEPREWDRFWREIVPQRQPKLANWLKQMGWEGAAPDAGPGARQRRRQSLRAGPAHGSGDGRSRPRDLPDDVVLPAARR